MKKIINLIFDRIERLLWFRHLLWILRKNGNNPYDTLFNPETGTEFPEKEDTLNTKCIEWLQKHRNDYKSNLVCQGKAMGTENSTDVNEDEP